MARSRSGTARTDARKKTAASRRATPRTILAEYVVGGSVVLVEAMAPSQLENPSVLEAPEADGRRRDLAYRMRQILPAPGVMATEAIEIEPPPDELTIEAGVKFVGAAGIAISVSAEANLKVLPEMESEPGHGQLTSRRSHRTNRDRVATPRVR